MSFDDRVSRQAFWRAEPLLALCAILSGHDNNLADELVHAPADTPSTPEIRSA
ncbi:hypothetical protein [Phenylobacterium sp.]|uniref:hypothetical protein n=1 Tax=Phenylobacterium sp. TaxID=1871053 RepID=UPI002FD943D4